MVRLTDNGPPRHNRPMPMPSITADATSHLARNVAALRHARGLTQQGLATAAGVPRSTVTSLESGTAIRRCSRC